MSREQHEALDVLLRKVPLDLGGEVAEQRVVIEEMMASTPLADDVTSRSPIRRACFGLMRIGTGRRSTPTTRDHGVVTHLSEMS